MPNLHIDSVIVAEDEIADDERGHERVPFGSFFALHLTQVTAKQLITEDKRRQICRMHSRRLEYQTEFFGNTKTQKKQKQINNSTSRSFFTFSPPPTFPSLAPPPLASLPPLLSFPEKECHDKRMRKSNFDAVNGPISKALQSGKKPTIAGLIQHIPECRLQIHFSFLQNESSTNFFLIIKDEVQRESGGSIDPTETSRVKTFG